MFKINGIDKTVLVIGDTHLPYSHPQYIEFLSHLKDKHKPDIIIHIGDEIDSHAISFHKSDSSLFNADAELDNAIIELQEGLHKLFPKMDLVESNHGSLIFRRLKAEGIPIRHLKPLNELYETPLWAWHEDILLSTKQGPVYLCHGKAAGYGKLCKEMMCSSIQGHHHSKQEITYHKSITGVRFNAFTGCLVDDESMAMAYARNNLPKSLLGSIIIDKNGTPIIERMRLDRSNRWIRE